MLSCVLPRLADIDMKCVLEQYGVVYFNSSRPHHGIAQQIPVSSPYSIRHKVTKMTSTPLLGGLHHDYRVAA
jgi:hypothetical protein